MSSLSSKASEPVGALGSSEKNKQWQRELLMERLRSHSNQHKTFQELSKAMRMSMLEKRYALDAVEKSNLQKCLDSMQHCIKVTTRQGLVERLESLSRQLGLKFMEDTSGLFISSDMFYLEIIIDHNGTLSDVKVHHECKIEQQSCSELVNCLLNSDFTDFTVQLEGLSSIYQLNAEPKVKSKAFVALQAMETDLYNLFTMQNFHKDTQTMLMSSSVGIVQKRRGGHPMKLIYFVHPYDLLNLETKTMLPLTLDLIATKNIGMSVTVNLEASSANKLQILPTVSFNPDPQGASIPIYSPMTSTNSTLLPATFVLRLNKPLPVCDALRQTITHSTESSLWDPKVSTSIMQHIVQTASDGQMQHSSRGLFVTLPDQNHCYFFTENKKMKGSIITSVPFTEPSQVPKILSVLKRQALFHTLLGSCVRTQSKMGDLESTVIVEVNAISIYQISVALQHPFEESMATIEFDLSDATTIMCRVYSLTNNYDVISVKLSKIAQISLSIPVTVRALLKYWEQERLKPHRGLENGNFNLPLGPSDPGGRNNDMRDIKTKSERNINGNFTGGNRQFFHPSGVMMNSADAFSENSVNMFCPSNESSMMNQFAMKTNNEMNFTDVGAIKGYQTGEDFCKSPKSNVDINCPQFSENSDSSSLGTSTPTSDSGVATHAFQKAMRGEKESTLKGTEGSDLKGSNMAVNEIIGKGDSASTRDKQLPSTISITPVSGEGNPLSGIDLNKRPGIEIIPITGSANHPLSTTITITPINAVKGDKKSNSSKRNEDKVKGEKKRKRKKEDLSMGPPEKMISKQQEVLNRQLTATGKLSLDSSMSKLSHSVPSKLSPPFSTTTNLKTSPKGSPVCTSLKYLSGGTAYPKTQYSITSPKQGSSTSSGKPSMSALKSVTNSLSPKSDRSKASNKERDHREKDRIKVSVGGNSPKIKSSTVKLKQIDLNSTFLPINEQTYFEDGPQNLNTLEMGTLSSASGGSSGGASHVASQPKVRKNSLNAVIDKLKSAQNTGDDACQLAQKLMESDRSGPNAYTKLSTTGGLSLKATSNSSNMNVNSEYMIKPSLDGMKITINKTRSKDVPLLTYKASSPNAFSKIASHSSSGSPKKHTGLKPGTISGPASKKGAPQFNSSKSSSALSLPASQTKSSFQKSHSSGNLTSKSSTISKNLSSSSFSEAFRKDKSNKSKNAINEKPAVTRPDPTDVMKILRFASPNNAMEGFMKSLNTKFQIPKLSARSSDDSKKAISTSAPTTPVSAPSSSPPITSSGSTQSSTDSIAKSFSETMTKNTPKYPLPLVQSNPNPLPNNALPKVSYPPLQTSPMFSKDFHLPKSSSSDTILAMHKDQPIKQFSSTPPTPSHMTFSSFAPPSTNALVNSSPMIRSSPSEPVGVQAPLTHEMAMRPPSAPCAVDMTKNTELDLSMKSENRSSEQQRSGSNSSSLRKVPSTQKMSFPPSPSVSLHIVKSPAPSPLVMPSPHSNSPCITDDELMDEALVGIGGK